MKVRFSILHYGNPQITIDCIDSILALNTKNLASITIVDNGAPAEGTEVLKKKYKNNPLTDILISNKNLGFAKGNNLGFEHEKRRSKSDLIVVMNNDIVIEDREFIEKCLISYQKNKFDLAGPDIINLEKEHQNPFRKSIFSLEEVKRRIKIKRIFLLYYKMKKYIPLFEKIKILENRFEKQTTNRLSDMNYKAFQEGIVLQGACIIYGPNYIKNEDWAFYPETFMYGEEDILAYYCKTKGYKMVYEPALKIYHLDGASTKKEYIDQIDKNIFFNKNVLESTKILKEKMIKDGEMKK